MQNRKFTPYEYTQLNKHGFDPISLSETIDINIPIEYITGKVEFRGTEYEVNNNVLIPRVETEEIIDIAINLIAEKIKNQKLITFCDIGTGSGVIGISFAKELLKKRIHFHGYLTDKSKSAIKVAQRNARRIFDLAVPIRESDDDFRVTIPLEKYDYLTIVQADLLTNIQIPKCDLIISNLPYIPSSRISNLDLSVKNFEPINALDGGEDGLEIIRKLITQAQLKLKKGGALVLEVDDTHTNAEEFMNLWNIQIMKDSLGNTRFWIMQPL